MAKDNSMGMPGGFGGLMRYNEEFPSRFMLDPKHVIIFVIIIALFVIGLKIFFPVQNLIGALI